MIEYVDFSLKIEPKQGDVYPVIVLDSPAGEARSTLYLPFEPDQVGSILFGLGQTVRGIDQPQTHYAAQVDITTPEQVGGKLFDALFTGPVRSLLDRSLGMIHGSQRGLRIKIHVDPEDPSLAQLASLPWEFLYCKETRDFLNLSRQTPVLRYLDVQRPRVPLVLNPPLRILVVISSPIDSRALDLDGEQLLIEQSWARQENVEVDYLEKATISALQDRLMEQPYHVLHYMGHGDFDERTGHGVLLLEDDEGKSIRVSGKTLGILLRNVPTLRLAFLNACETARVAKQKGLDPFTGVAAAMVMAGIPAVVAMQFPISDAAAITFSQRFYALLARGYPVDTAVVEGRMSICLAKTMEWGTPVLFMRAPKGVIFRIPESRSTADEKVEWQLEQLYTDGIDAFDRGDWTQACRRFQAVMDLNADYKNVAVKLDESAHLRDLDSLYSEARTAREAGNWDLARACLEKLLDIDSSFRDARAMLEAVNQHGELTTLYARAQLLSQQQKWQDVVNIIDRIAAIAPEYGDPEGLRMTAQQEIAKQERNTKRKRLLIVLGSSGFVIIIGCIVATAIMLRGCDTQPTLPVVAWSSTPTASQTTEFPIDVVATDTQTPPIATSTSTATPISTFTPRPSTATPQPVAVPNTEGMVRAAAVQLITDAGLVPKTETEHHAEIDAGLVTRTDPEAGKEVPRGTGITVYVSAGTTPVLVPDVSRRAITAAKAELELQQLHVKAEFEETHATIAKGLVTRTDPEAGEEVPRDTEITVYVSRGPVCSTGNITLQPAPFTYHPGAAGGTGVEVGENPTVTVRALLGHNDSTVYLSGYMRVVDRRVGTTDAVGTWSKVPLGHVDSSRQIRGILMESDESRYTYVDTDYALDVIKMGGGGPVYEFRFWGSTEGDDIGGSDDDTGVTIHFNPIVVDTITVDNCVAALVTVTLQEVSLLQVPAGADSLTTVLHSSFRDEYEYYVTDVVHIEDDQTQYAIGDTSVRMIMRAGEDLRIVVNGRWSIGSPPVPREAGTVQAQHLSVDEWEKGEHTIKSDKGDYELKYTIDVSWFE